jgi:hypothetical protein
MTGTAEDDLVTKPMEIDIKVDHFHGVEAMDKIPNPSIEGTILDDLIAL